MVILSELEQGKIYGGGYWITLPDGTIIYIPTSDDIVDDIIVIVVS